MKKRNRFISMLATATLVFGSLFVSCEGSADDGEEYVYTSSVDKELTITFNANDGSAFPATKTQKAKRGAVTLDANTFTRSSYTFKGWAESASSSTVEYEDKATAYIYSDKTLYAVWKANEKSLSVIFNGNGGTTSDGSTTTTQTVKYPSSEYSAKVKFEANPFTKEGCSFIGWASSAEATKADYVDEATTSLYYDKTLYAVWVSNDDVITITLDSNNGSGETKTVNAVKNQETSLTQYSDAFEWEYGKINGWLKNKTDTEKTTSFTFTEDTTIYASWKENPKITFDANGGKASDESTKKYQYLKGSYVGNGLFEQFVPEGCNETSETVTVTLDANSFTREGYIFKGWGTYDVSTTVEYADKARLSISKKTLFVTYWNTPTLYAVWEKIPTITCKMNGGSDDADFSETGRKITTKTPTAKYSYYEFAKWNTSSSGTGTYYAGYKTTYGGYQTIYGGSSDITLYAQWELGDILNYKSVSVAKNTDEQVIATFTLIKDETLTLIITNPDGALYYTISNGTTNSYESGKIDSDTTKTIKLSKGTYTLKATNKNMFNAHTAKISLY